MANQRIDVKEAITTAIASLNSAYELKPTEKPRLEETVYDERGRWLITLSFVQPGIFDQREYKIFEIDAGTKEVIAMRIREPAVIDGGVY